MIRSGCARALAAALLANASVVALSISAVHAQTAQSPNAKSEEIVLEEINVDGKKTKKAATTEGTGSYTTGETSSSTGLGLSIKETPQSVTVQTRQRLDDQNLQETEDVLRQTPGIHYEESGSQGSDSNTFYARGFPVNNFQVDGVNQSNLYRGSDQINDTFVYDRIEIVRGASGLMTGSGDPSASINFFRKKPTDETQFMGAAQTGSWDRYRGEFDFSGPLNEAGTVRGRFLGAAQDENSFIDRLEKTKGVLYGVVEADVGDATTVTFGTEYQKHQAEDASRAGHPLFFDDGTLANLPRSTNSATDWADTESEKLAVFGVIEHELDNGWNVKLDLDRTTRTFNEIIGYAIRADPGLQHDGSGMGIWAGRWDGEAVQNSAKLTVTGTYDLAGREHDLVFGLSGHHAEQDGGIYKLWWDVPGSLVKIPNYFTWNGSFPSVVPDRDMTRLGDYINTRQEVSAFAATRLSVTDDLSLILGGRVTNWLQSTDNRYYNPATADTYDELSGDGEFIPYAGAVYDLTDIWSVYASYTSIFNPQDAIDFNKNFLAPIMGKAYEAGVKAGFYDDRLNATFALFRIEQDNVAIEDPNFPGLGYSIAVPGTSSEGFEIELQGALTEDWQIGAGLTYADVRDNKDELLMPYVPDTLFKVFTTYRLPGKWNDLTIGGNVYWQSDVTTTWTNSANVEFDFKQDSFATLDLMARYDINDHVSLALNVNNVFDKEYYTSISGGLGYFGEPRNALLTLRGTW